MMQKARYRAACCYLCNQSLPPRSSPEFKLHVMGEHVIPRELLGEMPDRPQDRWPIELDVHEACERENKERHDHFMKLFMDVQTKPFGQWPKSHLRASALKRSAIVFPVAKAFIPMLSGMEKLCEAVWMWVRGMHMALYGQGISLDANWSVIPPVPASIKGHLQSLKGFEELAKGILSSVTYAVRTDQWDGVVAWGAEVDYRCAWHCDASRAERERWDCFWSLIIPGVLKWSQSALEENQRPWLGCYLPGNPPKSVSSIVLPSV